MRRAKLSLGLILAITLFASAVPAAASHPAPSAAVTTGFGRLSGGDFQSCAAPLGGGVNPCAGSSTHEMFLESRVCTGDADAGIGWCDLEIFGIQLTPVNGAGPNCQIFGGSGGQGTYQYTTNGTWTTVELNDVGWRAATAVGFVLGSSTQIALEGTYTHEGETRPFVGEIVVQSQTCFKDGVFEWEGAVTLL